MRLKVDVLVVGLGPAGACAARAAAEAGAAVIAIERRRTVGVPVQCAEFVPLPMGKYALASDVFRQRVDAMTTILPSGERVVSNFPGIMIDRAQFDQALARAARQVGAEAFPETVLDGVDAARSIATVRRNGEARPVGYRVLIAADGPLSRVGASIGLPSLETVASRQYVVPLLRRHTYTDVFLSADYPGGYAWLFPKGSVANLGLGMDPRLAPDLKTPLEALHRQLADAGLIGMEIIGRTGGPIPVGGLRERLAVGNVLFAGDAAGLTHPITGAGIAAAVISGEAAGVHAVRFLSGEAGALADYEQDIRDQFETALTRAVARRRSMLQIRTRPEARADAAHRRGWIAFPEYFDDSPVPALDPRQPAVPLLET
jgi:geranylgeranyl reductase family protein